MRRRAERGTLAIAAKGGGLRDDSQADRALWLDSGLNEDGGRGCARGWEAWVCVLLKLGGVRQRVAQEDKVRTSSPPSSIPPAGACVLGVLPALFVCVCLLVCAWLGVF